MSSPFKLTTIRDLADTSNRDTISLKDILGNPLIKEAWVFNFCFDIDWMMQYFDPDVRDMVKVEVVHGSWKKEDMNKLAIDDACSRWPNVEAAVAYLPDPFGTHHSKMFVLFTHDDHAEVIIHTANMLAKDWTNMTQAVWRSGPLPRTAQSGGGGLDPIGTGSRFKYDLMEYLKAYRNPAKALVNQLRSYDFSSVSGALLASVPAKVNNVQLKSTPEQHLWGYPQLREAVRYIKETQTSRVRKGEKRHLVAQVSSIATLHQGWLETLSRAFDPTNGGIATPSGLSIIYPTAPNVAQSLDGYAAGGSIHIKAQSAAHHKQIESLRPHLHQWVLGPRITSRSMRDIAAPHIKTYFQFNTKPTQEALDERDLEVEWALVTSANLSIQAWGSMPRSESNTKKKSKNEVRGVEEGLVQIQSFEIGVMVWPGLYENEDTSGDKPGQTGKARMVPVFGTDTPSTATTVNNSDTTTVVGLRMPYDLPLTPYGPKEFPWSPGNVYASPDSHGRSWG